jgi:hypothetical protein
MSLKAREFCKNLNGDRWFLLYESDSGEVLVNHRPNAASGCRPSLIPVGEFLFRTAYYPEHRALLRLIGTLVEHDKMTEGILREQIGGLKQGRGHPADQRAMTGNAKTRIGEINRKSMQQPQILSC